MQILVGALALAAFSVTPTQALASWLQLYIGAMKSGTVFEISGTDRNIHALKKAVKVEVEPKLNHCDAADLEVFPVGTLVPIPDGTEPLCPGMKLSELDATTDEKPLIVVAPPLLQQQRYKPEKEFDLEHLKSIKVDGSWVDCAKGFNFVGRIALTSQVKETLQWLKVKGTTYIKSKRALVYSSVSGSGKTVSMLHLKTSLRDLPDMQVIVAYLGFDARLRLKKEEREYIDEKKDVLTGAEEVLARRLAAATIISHENPQEVYKLPDYEQVYHGYQIPSVKESMSLILECTKATPENPIYIVAGVDEVQLLNRVAIAEGSSAISLGRLFLRILQTWQSEWSRKGIRLLPLGTGIALDWLTNPTVGYNIPLDGDDATLISKQDFHKLVTDIVDGLSDEQFTSRCSDGTSKATAIDLVAAAFWPRVRLLQWWRNGETEKLHQRPPDSNHKKWVKWLCYWLRGDIFSCISDQDDVPGKGDEGGSIRCLFQLSAEDGCFSVIPDGYSSEHLIDVLSEQLPVPHLYDGLRVIKSLQPKEFILADAYCFENLGFFTVGTSIHVGLHALNQKRITASSASPTQKKRLGLAMWFQDQQAVTHKKEQLFVPRVLGPVDSTGNFGEYYPFKNGNQTTFDDTMVKSLLEGVKKRRPVYIRCGPGTCCDYLYFYVRVMHSNKAELICNICDAKHTNNIEEGGSANIITTNDQVGLFRAVEKVHCAVKNANLVLGNVRLLFVTNRDKLVEPNAESPALKRLTAARQAAYNIFPEVQLELLNKDSFDFGPFSDILMARRKKRA